jgi:hypothetical protein
MYVKVSTLSDGTRSMYYDNRLIFKNLGLTFMGTKENDRATSLGGLYQVVLLVQTRLVDYFAFR